MKLAQPPRFVRRAAATAVVAATIGGCGYRPALANGAARPSYSLDAAPFATPDLVAIQAALGGARAELAREGSLSSGSGYPQIVVEVVRVDELGTGIRAEAAPGGPLPLASASEVGVVERGWIVESAGAPPSHESGDVRCSETVAQAADATTAGAAFDEGVRAAAKRAGRIVARRVLGFVEPAVEPM